MRHKGWTYIIYDEKEGDVPVFEADTIDEIARWLDMEKRVVVCEVCRGCLIRRRYRAYRVYLSGRTYGFRRNSIGPEAEECI